MKSPRRNDGPKRPLRIARLRRSQLPSDTVRLARYLIGKTLVHDHPAGRLAGRIVETEAYPPGDAAGHAYIGQTARNRSLFKRRAHAYIYFIYGSSFMVNVSSEHPGVGAGVLLRAIEPLEGIERMKRRSKSKQVRDLGRGPGRLAKVMRIDRGLDGIDLCALGPLWLGRAVRPAGRIAVSVRIGITREAHRKLRFYERGNPCVSGPKRLCR